MKDESAYPSVRCALLPDCQICEYNTRNLYAPGGTEGGTTLLLVSPSNDEAAAFFWLAWASRAIRALLSTSPIFFPKFSSISLRSCSLSSSVIVATRLSFSSLIRTRHSSVSGSFGGTSSCVLGASCTTGGTAACDESAVDCCWAPRFRAKTLFDLCCAVGKPVLDRIAFGVEGENVEEPRFRSKTEPMRGLLFSDIIDCGSRNSRKMVVEVETWVSGAHATLINSKASYTIKGTWCRWFITLA